MLAASWPQPFVGSVISVSLFICLLVSWLVNEFVTYLLEPPSPRVSLDYLTDFHSLLRINESMNGSNQSQ